jgi:anaerobic selenocysteine-containing dehydrogenase
VKKHADDTRIVRSTCTLCTAGCGVLIEMRAGEPVQVRGDPDHPGSRGVLCARGRASLDHPRAAGRLTHPLMRRGDRGSGRWRRASWDEALDAVAEGLTRARTAYGAESVAFIRGVAKGYQDRYLARLANLFGSPNALSTSHICWVPQVYAARLTYGFDARGDYAGRPACLLVWGADPAATNLPRHVAMEGALAAGAKLVVVDPSHTAYARRADVWARPRPGSDLALALGVIRVILDEELHDVEFVESRTVGVSELREAVDAFTPEETERLTWVEAGAVQELARTYATSQPAVLESGWGIDGTVNSFQTGRALAILRAITGNVGRSGGEIEWQAPAVVAGSSPELNQQDALPPAVRARRIGAEQGMLPTYYAALPQRVIKAMLTSEPYPVRAAYVAGASMLQSYSDVHEVRRALESLDFFAVADQYMTPTAELADVVLPVATYLETDSIHQSSNEPVVSIVQKVIQVGEAWSDLRICNALAARMGFGEGFWEDEQDALDYLLRPSGLTFEEFRSVSWLRPTKDAEASRAGEFATPSGKIELSSERLEDWGFDPLPVYREPPETPLSAPGMATRYPLVLTGRKSPYYYHSGGRQIPALRQRHPDAVVVLHPETAAAAGVREGDRVIVETPHGTMRQQASLSTDIDPRVVLADPLWWYPERGPEDLHGWAESNVNVLTRSDPPYCREMGSTTLRGFLCRVTRENG